MQTCRAGGAGGIVGKRLPLLLAKDAANGQVAGVERRACSQVFARGRARPCCRTKSLKVSQAHSVKRKTPSMAELAEISRASMLNSLTRKRPVKKSSQ